MTALRGRGCILTLDRPRIMGILNVTPDSFSDGGRYNRLDTALRHAETMAADGADIIDVGGESTRPGAAAVSEEVELDRVIPVVEALRRHFDIPLSVDTSKAAVAREALACGAAWINDVSGLTFDPQMAPTVAAAGGGLFVMHTRGTPATMQNETGYDDLIGEVRTFLLAAAAAARAAGIDREALAVDPGIGFGKDQAGNLEILRHLDVFAALGYPLLLGTSRKRFIGAILDRPEADNRLYGTLATVALGVAAGAMIHRVHDVGPARDVALMSWAILHGA